MFCGEIFTSINFIPLSQTELLFAFEVCIVHFVLKHGALLNYKNSLAQVFRRALLCWEPQIASLDLPIPKLHAPPPSQHIRPSTRLAGSENLATTLQLQSLADPPLHLIYTPVEDHRGEIEC